MANIEGPRALVLLARSSSEGGACYIGQGRSAGLALETAVSRCKADAGDRPEDCIHLATDDLVFNGRNSDSCESAMKEWRYENRPDAKAIAVGPDKCGAVWNRPSLVQAFDDVLRQCREGNDGHGCRIWAFGNTVSRAQGASDGAGFSWYNPGSERGRAQAERVREAAAQAQAEQRSRSEEGANDDDDGESTSSTLSLLGAFARGLASGYQQGAARNLAATRLQQAQAAERQAQIAAQQARANARPPSPAAQVQRSAVPAPAPAPPPVPTLRAPPPPPAALAPPPPPAALAPPPPPAALAPPPSSPLARAAAPPAPATPVRSPAVVTGIAPLAAAANARPPTGNVDLSACMSSPISGSATSAAVIRIVNGCTMAVSWNLCVSVQGRVARDYSPGVTAAGSTSEYRIFKDATEDVSYRVNYCPGATCTAPAASC
jgi:hypothetical protein